MVTLNTQLDQLGKHLGEVVEEEVLVVRIPLHPGLERRVRDECDIRGQHHELLLALLEIRVLVHKLAHPTLQRFGRPLELEQQLEELVREPRRVVHPRTVEPAAVNVRPAQVVPARQRDDLLVGEAHAVEDEAQVFGALRAIGQTAARGHLGVIDEIGPAGLPGDFGAAHLLDRGHASEGPQVRVCDPVVAFFDGFEEGAAVLQTGVGGVATLGFVAHTGAVGAASVGVDIIGAGGVPIRVASQHGIHATKKKERTHQANRTKTGPALPSS